MNPFTKNFTHTTTTGSSNDASNYPQGQFIDPALLQLNTTTSAPQKIGHRPAAEMSRNRPGSFQTQNLSGPNGSSSFGRRNNHASGTSAGTTTATSTASRQATPIATVTAPHLTTPTYARGEYYIPPSLPPLPWWGQNGGMYFAPLSSGFPAQQPPHIQYQLPTPAPTPAGAQVEYGSFIGYYPVFSYYGVHQPQLGLGPLGIGYTSFAASNAAPVSSSLPRSSEVSLPLAPVVAASRGPGHGRLPTSFPMSGLPSEHVSAPSQITVVPNMPTPSRLEAGSDVGECGNPGPPIATRSGDASTRATEQSKSKIHNKKPYNRRMKNVDSEPSVQLSGGRRPPPNHSRFVAGEVEAPRSPKISVKMVPNPTKGSKTKGKAEGKGEAEGVQRNRNSDELKDHIYAGLGTNVDTCIQAMKPASNAELSKKALIPSNPGDRYRCRWDGCQCLIPATRKCVKAHMRAEHGIKPPSKKLSSQPSSDANSRDDTSSTKIACLWCPPLLVRSELGGGELSAPFYVTSHALSYHCGKKIEPGSVVNHVGTHLGREGQPNPMAEICICGQVVVTRGGHKCPEMRAQKAERLRQQGY